MFVFMMFILAACGNDETIEEEIQVSFDSGGGTVLNPRVVIKNDPPSAFSEPTKEGYNFLGWYVDDEYLEAFSFDLLDEFSDDFTLYARWEAITIDEDDEEYTVYFDYLDGNPLEEVSVLSGETVDEPELLIREGFEFVGWFETPMFDVPFDFEGEIVEDTYIFAKYLEYFDVDFNVDGDVIETIIVLEQDSIRLIDSPEKQGYSFTGWYTSDIFIESFLYEDDGVISDMTLYAGFEQNTYTITFEAGSYTVESMEVLYDTSITLPNLEEADNFIGWYLEDTFDTRYFGEIVHPNDITLYARFGSIYTVTYYVDDEIYFDQAYSEGDTLSFPDAPDQEGYEFLGWRRQMGGFVFDWFTLEGESVNFHLDLLATFEPKTYSISFENSDKESIELSYKDPLDLTYDDMFFIGFYLDSDYEEKLDYETMPAYDLTLYPKITSLEAVNTLETVLEYQLSAAKIEGRIIHGEYLDQIDQYFYVLRDDTAQVSILINDPFEIDTVDKNVLVVANLAYDGFAVIDSVESIEAFESSVLEPITPIDVEMIPSIDSLDMQSETYTTEGFIFIEGGEVNLFDYVNERIYPILNMSASTAYDDLLSGLSHPYVSFGFTIITYENQQALIYLPEIDSMEEVTLNDSEKLNLLSNILLHFLETETFNVGDALEISGTDPFFGATLDVLISGESAHYYDSENDQFLYTESNQIIDLELTIVLNDESVVIDYQGVLKGRPIDGFSEVAANQTVVLEGALLYVDGNQLLFGNSSESVWLTTHNQGLFTLHDTYIIEASFTKGDNILYGVVDRLLKENDQTYEPNITFEPLSIETLYTSIEASNGVIQTFEGVILRGDHYAYPYILSDGINFIHLAFEDLESYVGEKITIDLLISDYIGSGAHEGYVGTYLEEISSVEVLMFQSFDQMLFSEKLLNQSLEDIYRPNRDYILPLAFEDLSHTIEYTLMFGDSNDVIMISDETLLLRFEEVGTYQIQIEILVDGLTYQMNETFVVEDYVITSIEDALLDQNETYTFLVKADGTTREYDMVVSDGTGAFLIENNKLDVYLSLGETFKVSGNLNETDGHIWLEDPVFETLSSTPVNEPSSETVTLEDLLALSDPFVGLKAIEVDGVLSFPPSGIDMSITVDETIFLIARDPSESLWFDYLDQAVTLRGYYMYTPTFNQNVIVASEIIE